ncbi:TetR/AcrR family transcriptional regulator [Leptolyngbya sp. CCNP1308]|uniref:TetR/AcrR family transcriptional regulator n=1 Tax=Leptolyngbya sp. CCNP1308 TaxID=3110255 RepID=UPI002B219794|nr:TetR/AcrR family transcriptional regulator [Leptolyngbya sp. CCNP1308]MEA5449565.1 TetR/AcrR family transcriptional regulator [Leptolyngbya sp. CCNP1308]
MPNATFFNLPEAKRQGIIDCAIAEFASTDYDSASISNITKQAKIAKGSFYQYFEDKKDLYLHLIDLASQQKIAYLKASQPPDPDIGFFAYLRWLFSASTQFELAHPALSQLVNRAFYGELSFRDQVLQRTQMASLSYGRELVEQGIAQGDIDASIDVDFAVFILSTLSYRLRDFIPQQLGLTPEQLAQNQLSPEDCAAIERIFDELVRVLEHGLGRSPAPAQSIPTKSLTQAN